MLLITRRPGESFFMLTKNGKIEIKILRQNDDLMIGIDAPKSVKIYRDDIVKDLPYESLGDDNVGNR